MLQKACASQSILPMTRRVEYEKSHTLCSARKPRSTYSVAGSEPVNDGNVVLVMMNRGPPMKMQCRAKCRRLYGVQEGLRGPFIDAPDTCLDLAHISVSGAAARTYQRSPRMLHPPCVPVEWPSPQRLFINWQRRWPTHQKMGHTLVESRIRVACISSLLRVFVVLLQTHPGRALMGPRLQ